MNKGLMLKVYDVDYSFIVKNYLDEKLWEKEWTIFIYKHFQMTVKLSSINVKSKKIWFEVTVTDNSKNDSFHFGKIERKEFSYNLNIDNIEILKKTLNLTIFELIQNLEKNYYILYTEEYKRLENMQETEKEELREIAEDFLSDEGVSNSDIREAYVDYYIDKNEKVYEFKSNYVYEMKYKLLTDFYLVFLKSVKDEERIKIIESYLNETELEKVLEEIKEYEEYMETEDFRNDMQDELEEI